MCCLLWARFTLTSSFQLSSVLSCFWTHLQDPALDALHVPPKAGEGSQAGSRGGGGSARRNAHRPSESILGSSALQQHPESTDAAGIPGPLTPGIVPSDACSPKCSGRRELKTYKGEQSSDLLNLYQPMSYDQSTGDKRERNLA